MNKVKLAYFGSSDFSADFLEKLITDASMYRPCLPAGRYIEVKFVVTQPDRPVGRKQILTPTPIKSMVIKHNLEVFEINDLKIENSLKISNLKLKIQELDLVMLYAYAGIIPQEFLNWPKYGFWCLHPSLLPKYRGTSPMATALINGDSKTGVTIIKMDDQIDHGPIIAQEEYKILSTDKRPDLEKKLTDLGFEMFKKIVNVIARNEDPSLSLRASAKQSHNDSSGQAPQSQNEIATLPSVARNDIFKLIPQSHSDATYTKKLKKDDGFIEFENFKFQISNSSETLFNRFRGLYPWPGLWTLLPNNKRLKITELNMVGNRHACSLQIKRVQLEGKKEVDFETFNSYYKLF